MSKNKEKELKEHQLFITPYRVWNKLKRDNKIAPSKRSMKRKIGTVIFLSSPFRLLQKLIIGRKVKRVNLQELPPIFVLGHWRSGTTHLHYLLSQDDRFSHLTSFQAFFFQVAFVSKKLMKPILRSLMPSTRPQDNVKIDDNSPQEEEHPLVNTTHRSGMHMFFFPKNLSYFTKYNVFKDISEKDLKGWKKDYYSLLQHIALFNGVDKRLLLKNPHSTGRLKVLNELFPESKFIFIHRNPYDVYSSMRILYDRAIKTQYLQEISDEEIHERIMHCYEESMRAFSEQRSLISKHIEIVGFDELDKDALKVVKRVYENLELGEFDTVLPKMKAYLDSVKNFKKNKKKPLHDSIVQEINERWDFAFTEWGYEKILPESEPTS